MGGFGQYGINGSKITEISSEQNKISSALFKFSSELKFFLLGAIWLFFPERFPLCRYSVITLSRNLCEKGCGRGWKRDIALCFAVWRKCRWYQTVFARCMLQWCCAIVVLQGVVRKIMNNYFVSFGVCCTFATRKGVLCPFLTENEINR